MNTKAILVMIFVVAGFVVPSLADLDTVGVYDPTDTPWSNDVDQSGTFDSGTGGADASNVVVAGDSGTWAADFATFKANVLTAFNNDMGGVVDFEGATGDPCVSPIIYAIYGTNGLKTVDITGMDGTLSINTGEGSNNRQPISGDYSLDNSNSNFDFDIGVTDGDDYERVVVFGGTVIDRRFGAINPSVTATFSDGSTVTSKALIGDHVVNDEDTFFGFVAPVDRYIVSVNFNLGGSTYMDDLVFITDIMPATMDAGPDQTVELYDVMAGNGSVVMDANVLFPRPTENYSYAWTSVPPGGVVFTPNGTSAAEDPTVTFTTGGVHTLTVLLTGDEGAFSADDVIITVIVPTVDAGPDQTSASGETVELDSTIINPYEPGDPNETYTYLWSGDFVNINNATLADPNAIFTGAGTHVVTLNVTGSIYGALASDTVDIFIVSDANWVGPDGGDWNTPANWSINAAPGVPGTSNTARLGKETFEAANATTIVEVDAAVSVYNIELAYDPCYPYILNVNNGVAVETVGDLNIASEPDNAAGIVNVLGASTITIGDDLIIGDDGVGTFIAEGGSTIIINDNLDVGDNGQGTFIMTGGTLTVGGDINVSKDDGGTGVMDVNDVTINCGDDFYVASNDDDETGTGVGIVTIVNNSVIVIADNLIIGDDGTGIFTATDSKIDVDGEVEVGRRSSGTLILNNTDITTDDQGELRVGTNDGGDGEVIMTNGSTIETDDHVSIGGGYPGDGNPGGNGVGTLTMTDSDIVISSSSLRDFIVCKKAGTGTLTMHGESSILIEDDFHVAMRDTAVGIVVMDGNSFIEVGDSAKLGGALDEDDGGTGWGTGDDTMVRLTMSDTATIHSDGKFFFGMMPDPDKYGSGNRNELRMTGDTQINVKTSNANMWIAKYADSYAYVEIDDSGTRPKIICEELRIGEEGGGCDFDIENGTIEIRNHLKVAHNVENNPLVAPVTIIINNRATIDVENNIRIGGEGAQVTIELIDGTIDQSKSDGDVLSMPYSGPSGATGYARIILGKDANNDLDPGDAELKVDGSMDGSYAGENDYFDFLGGGRLTVEQDDVTEPNIVDFIASGYFRTSYSQTDLYGVALGAGESYRVVYRSVDGGNKWRVEVGIVGLDFGDAPDDAGTPVYPTLLVNDGARHIIDPNAPYFDDASDPCSDAPDAELDGQPNATATGDDIAGATPDDEDGVVLVPLTIGTPGPITFTVETGANYTTGYVSAWIDYNANGVFDDSGETLLSGAAYGNGTFVVMATAPAGSAGTTYVRFRITSVNIALDPHGLAHDGEVEDHTVEIVEGGCACLGDSDASNNINIADMSAMVLFLGPYVGTTPVPYTAPVAAGHCFDIDGDLDVDIADMSAMVLFLGPYVGTTPVPYTSPAGVCVPAP